MSNVIFQMTEADLRSLIKQSLTEVFQNSSLLKSKEDMNEIFTIDQAANFLSLSKPTIYYYTSKNLIPFSKQGKRVFFSKSDLISWIKAGRQKTITERMVEVKSYLSENRK